MIVKDVRPIVNRWLKSKSFFWLLCGGIVIILYYPALVTASFRRDDLDWIALVQSTGPFESLLSPLWGIIWRPVVALHFYVLRIVFRQPPLVFFAANLLIHTILGGLVYTAVSRMYDRRVALLAALVFVTRPGIADAVAWPSAVGVMYAGACGLGSILCYEQFLRHRYFRWYAPAFLLGIVAILSKEEAIFLPFVLVLLIGPRLSHRCLGEFLFTFPFWLAALVSNGYRLHLAGGTSFWNPETVQEQIVRFARGLARSVAPFDTWVPPFSTMVSPLRVGALLLGLAVIPLLLWLGYPSLRHHTSARKNLLLFVSCLVLAIAPVTLSGHEVAWRYEYLPILVASFLYATLLRILDLSNRDVIMYLFAASVIVTNVAQLYLWRGAF